MADGPVPSTVSRNTWLHNEEENMTTSNAATSIRSAAVSTERVLTVERLFEAPRHLVFKAWIEPQQLYRWFGPRGFTISSYTMDPRPGGPWRICMVSSEGREYWVRGRIPGGRRAFPLVFHLGARRCRRRAWARNFGDRHPFRCQQEKPGLILRQEIFESVTARDEHQTRLDQCARVPRGISRDCLVSAIKQRNEKENRP